LLACAAVALAFALLCPALQVDDSSGYLGPARSLAAGHGLRESDGSPIQQRLPAYPLALGVAIAVLGDGPHTPGLLNVACLIGAVLLVRRGLGTAVPPGRRDAVLAAALVYPPLLTSPGLVLQESFVALLLALLFLLAMRSLGRPSAGRAALLGLALGATCLAKTTALPLALPGALALRGRARLAFLAVLGLVLGGWMAHNARALGRPQLANANGGFTLLGGTVSNQVAAWSELPEYVEAVRAWEASGRPGSLDGWLYEAALGRIRADPGRFLRLIAERAVLFALPARHWFFTVGWSRPGEVDRLFVLGCAVQALLFGATAWVGRDVLRGLRPPSQAVLPVLVAAHHAAYALVYASPRYGTSVGPLLFGSLALALSPSSSSQTRSVAATMASTE
jgi:hypothetical protein